MISDRFYTSMDIMALDINSEYLGVSRHKLMENAGASVANYVREKYPKINKVLIIAGLGNNGGDGFVAARHLSRYYEVYVDLIGESSRIRTEEARENFDALKRMEYSIRITENATIDEVEEHVKMVDLIVDAILGTGVKGELREPVKSIVSIINNSGKPVICVDTPTGLDPTTGRICGSSVKANATITFHGIKRGFVGREEYTGEVIISNIGIPFEAEILVGPGDFEVIKRLEIIKSNITVGISNHSELELREDIRRILTEKGISFKTMDLSDKYVDVAVILTPEISKERIASIKRNSALQIVSCVSLEDIHEYISAIGPAVYLVKVDNIEISRELFSNMSDLSRLSKENNFRPIILYSSGNKGVLIASNRWIKFGVIEERRLNEWILASSILSIALNDELYSYTGTLWLYREEG